MKIEVDKTKCPQNHSCPAVKVCPMGAIEQKGFDAPVINGERCIKCRQCVIYCPMKAIKLI